MFACVFEFTGECPGGRALHGWYFDQLAAVDPALATRLHAPGARRPFTWAVLPSAVPGEFAARLTVFGAELECFAAARPNIEPGKTVVVGGRPLTAVRVHGADGDHSWCGHDELTGLVERCEPIDRATMEFVTPTTFRFGDQVVAAPVERLIVGSWLRAWRAAGGEGIGESAAAELRREVVGRGSATRVVPAWPNSRVEAFVGTATLGIGYGASPAARKALSALTRFAFYCGTGWKTAMSLGLTRRVE